MKLKHVQPMQEFIQQVQMKARLTNFLEGQDTGVLMEVFTTYKGDLTTQNTAELIND